MTTTTTGSTDTSSYPAPAVSLARMFYDRVAATPRAEAFRFPAGTGWASLTWAQTAETVKTMAAGLLALGIQPEERVAIASATRIEWLYADLAIMCAGAATTAVYPSTGAEDAAFIISDSGTRVVFAEDQAQIAKLRARRDHLPDVIRVVTFDGQADGEWVLSLADLQALGAKHLAGHPAAVDEAVAAVGPENLATLFYTSGTTGRPKGVELPHRCWTYVGAGAEALGILSAGDLQYLWLPLSHAFGKMLETVQLQIGFPTAVDGRMDKIVENLAIVRPTFMAGPPRIFIAPQAIEVMFKAICPLASQVLVHADRRNYATALITLDPDALAQWGRAQGLTATSYAALTGNPAVRRYVQSCIEELNGRLNRWETVKDFRILGRDLTVEEGELTPSMKIKRNVVETKYESLLDSMYGGQPRG